MKAQRLAVVLIVGVVVVSTGAGVLLYTGGSDTGPDTQSDGTNSTGDDVAVLNQSADGQVYLDVASDPQRDRADLGHALDGLYDEKSINVSNIDFVDTQHEASTIAIATDGRSNATYIANWVEKHLDHPQLNADSDSSTDSETGSSKAQCGMEPTYYQIDFVAGETIEELQGPKGTYTPDELIRFAHSNSEKSEIRRSSNGEFTTNESLRDAVDSKSIEIEGDTAKVSFSISEDSAPVKLTLASYTKPQRIWTRATEHQQEFVDADTRTFKPGGSYTLTVDLPDSKVVPCETDTAPDQSDPSTETDTVDSPGTTEPSLPSSTPVTTTADGPSSATSTSDVTAETTNPETSESSPGTATSGTTTSETTAETTSSETTEESTTTPTTTPPTETPTEADLSVTKTVDDANATVGDNVTFTIDVTNNGPAAANNVSVTEMLGSGLKYQSGEVSQGVYDPVTGIYNVGTLANDETATLEITTTIESSTNTTNVVEVTSDQPDPIDPNNNDSVDPTPSVADLSLTKNVNESAPNVGENVEYTLTLANDGPNATSNVTVADTLPEGLTFVGANASQGDYNDTTGLWSVNSLADDAEATLSVVATVESSDGVTNVAEVNASDTFDPDSTPNNDDPDEDDRDNVTVDGQEADLAITKTVEDDNATVGDNVTFTVDVTNNGPDTASDVSVIESLNSGLSYQSAEATQGSYNEDTNVYEVGTLENGDTATLTITAQIESVENTSNAVAVTGEQPDPDPGDNTNTSDPDPNVADLGVTKTVNETNATVGDTVAFTVDVTNDGPDTATNVSVNESLESGLSFVSAETTQGEYNDDTSTYDVGALANGETATLTLTALVNSSENTSNTVEVTGDEPDPIDPNNNDTVDPSPTVADLSLTKNVNESTPNVGDNVEYTLELTNDGPNATSNVTVVDTLPEGLTFVNADANQGSYDADTGLWSVGSMASGESITVTIVARVDDPGSITNDAQVNASDVYDPDSTPDNDDSDEDDEDSVTIDGQQADLAVNKTVEDSNATVGDTVEFTIDVTNNGPNTATNVSAYETLDNGLRFEGASTTQGEYNASTGVYSVGTLDNGDTATLTLTATIESADDTTNAVEVTSDQPDPTDPNNNDAVDPSPIVSDLSINKTVDDTNATVGDNVDFTVEVTNNGPDTATNVSVDEELGGGLSFVEADASQGDYDADAGVYNVGTLANGDTATLTLTATVESVDDTTNAVNVTGDPFDPTDPNNNDSVDSPPSVADLALTKNVNESAPNVGENIEYTLTLSNDGPNATSNVTVTDALPDDLSFVSATAGQGSYDNASGLWTVGDIASGDEATLSVVTTIESTDDVTNIAEVNSSDTFDPNSTPNNNESDEDDQDSSIVNGQSADLAVTKTANATDATVGDNVTFTVDVTNNGPDAATNVSVTESLGNGFAFQNASTTQGSYDSNTSIYTVGTLESNETATLTVTATIESVDNTTNTVEVTGDQPDPIQPNNNDSANPTPAVADLSLAKNVNESAPNVGDTVEYTLTLTNDGPNETSGVSVADALPDGVSFVNASASQGSYDAGTNLWTVNSLPDDGEATLSVAATVESTDDITNVAEVDSSDTFDPDSTPNNDDPDEDDRGSTTINGQSTDLAVSKTVNNTDVTVGDTVAFTVEVTNNGPDAATNVAVDEMLGTGFAPQSTTVSQGSYDSDTNTYSVGKLASGETATLTLIATIESPDDTANVAEVTSDTPDPNDPNNNDSVDPKPSVADLSLTKSVNETSPNVGDGVEYTLTLTNNGPNATSNVTVADELPDGLVDVNVTASQGSYDAASGLWTVGTLGDGKQSTLTVTATVQSTSDVTNVAEVNSSDTFDPNSTPNNGEPGEDDQDNATVNGQSADLAVTKSVDDSGATVGDEVTFTVDVTNTGPDTARNVVVDDTLPTGLTFQGASATKGEYDESNGTYSVGDLANGETATLTLTATIEDTANLENVATATSDTFDPDDSNNEDSSTPSPQVADLSLTKSVDDPTPPANSNVEYTLTLTNDGPNTATGVEVTDTLPDGVTFEGTDGQGTYNADTGVWTVGELASGEETTLTIEASVGSTDDVENTAEVTGSDQFDPDSTPGNNVPGEDDQASTTVNGQEADLAVSKTLDDATVNKGDTVEFTVEVTNNGPDTATNVAVAEALGDGLSFQDASPSQGSYDESSDTYDVGALDNGATATLTVTATVESTENITNVATATSDTPDPDESNNEDSATPSPQVADLSLTKTVNESSPALGDNVAYTLTLANDGPNMATGVEVTDALPDGLSLVSADPATGSHDSGVWTVSELAAGEEATLTLTATVENQGDVANTAEVTASDQFDPDSTPGNNEPGEDDQASTTVSGQAADLVVTKTVDDSEVTVGDDVTFTVEVTNNGPNTARNVVVDETLPDGLTFVSTSPSQGSYDEADSSYDVGNLASGETATLELTATIEDTTDLENVATATSDTPDPDDTNNEDSVTPSPQVADLSLEKSVNESAPATGSGVEFTLTVTNNGPDATSSVAVEDALPDGLSFVEASGQGSYSADTGVWDVGDLAANEEATLTLTATVESSGEVTNTAEVTASDTFDPNSVPDNGEPGENDQDGVTLQPTAPTCNIQLDSVTAPDSVSQGEQATIEAGVTNNGLKDNCDATATLNATGESTQKVDIALLIDTSGSTQPYIGQIASKLSDFTDDLEAQGIDARFAVVSYGGNGYVRLDQRYTASTSQTRSTLNRLNSRGGVERNYGAIQAALNDLNPRSEANSFLIDVTDEDSDTLGDSGVPSSDPSQSQVANQIDSAGASFIAVSPTQDKIKNPEQAGYNPDQDIRVLSEQVNDGFWVNLFTPQSGDGDALNNFVDEFGDIVIERVNEGISREQSVTLNGGESGTLSFTVDTGAFQAGTDLEYTVTVGGETQTGTITVTGSGSRSASVAASAASTNETLLSPIANSTDTMSETTVPSGTAESSSESASNTTQTPTTDPNSETTTNGTKTVTDEPTETATETDNTATETPTTAGTETTQTPTETSTETTETTPAEEDTPTESHTETAETTATMVNTTTAAPTTEPQTAMNEAAETSTETENATGSS